MNTVVFTPMNGRKFSKRSAEYSEKNICDSIKSSQKQVDMLENMFKEYLAQNNGSSSQVLQNVENILHSFLIDSEIYLTM